MLPWLPNGYTNSTECLHSSNPVHRFNYTPPLCQLVQVCYLLRVAELVAEDSLGSLNKRGGVSFTTRAVNQLEERHHHVLWEGQEEGRRGGRRKGRRWREKGEKGRSHKSGARRRGGGEEERIGGGERRGPGKKGVREVEEGEKWRRRRERKEGGRGRRERRKVKRDWGGRTRKWLNVYVMSHDWPEQGDWWIPFECTPQPGPGPFSGRMLPHVHSSNSSSIRISVLPQFKMDNILLII